jgi:ArsR family transcriptional regulator
MKLHEKELLNELSEFYKLFADTTRLRILDTLINSDLCVSEITNILGLSQSLVSHQLRTLKMSNFVKSRREGQTIIYSIADEHIKIILEYGIEHIGEKNEKEN